MNLAELLLRTIAPKLAANPLATVAATVLINEGRKVLKRRKAARAAKKAG